MTILGQHTVAEARDLAKAVEFRVNKNIDQLQKVQAARFQPLTSEQRRLDADVKTFVERWVTVRDKQMVLMGLAVASNPNLHPSVLPAEVNFVALDNAARRDEPRLMDIQGRIEAEAHEVNVPTIDLSAMPGQHSPDADFLALQKLDAAIASAEASAKGAAKSNIGLIVGACVVGVVGLVVVTKVYL